MLRGGDAVAGRVVETELAAIGAGVVAQPVYTQTHHSINFISNNKLQQ